MVLNLGWVQAPNQEHQLTQDKSANFLEKLPVKEGDPQNDQLGERMVMLSKLN